jgi:hypothetical protein
VRARSIYRDGDQTGDACTARTLLLDARDRANQPVVIEVTSSCHKFGKCCVSSPCEQEAPVKLAVQDLRPKVAQWIYGGPSPFQPHQLLGVDVPLEALLKAMKVDPRVLGETALPARTQIPIREFAEAARFTIKATLGKGPSARDVNARELLERLKLGEHEQLQQPWAPVDNIVKLIYQRLQDVGAKAGVAGVATVEDLRQGLEKWIGGGEPPLPLEQLAAVTVPTEALLKGIGIAPEHAGKQVLDRKPLPVTAIVEAVRITAKATASKEPRGETISTRRLLGELGIQGIADQQLPSARIPLSGLVAVIHSRIGAAGLKPGMKSQLPQDLQQRIEAWLAGGPPPVSQEQLDEIRVSVGDVLGTLGVKPKTVSEASPGQRQRVPILALVEATRAAAKATVGKGPHANEVSASHILEALKLEGVSADRVSNTWSRFRSSSG